MVTSVRKHELTADDIVAVQLSNRQQHGEYVTYTALSSNGVDEYTVTLRGGRSLSCTCPATVSDCRHAKAAAFEEAWSSPVAVSVGHDTAQDLQAHIEDSNLAQIADEIVAAEHAAEKPVVVLDYEKVNSWIIENGTARCVRTADLALACPNGYVMAGEDGVERLNAILHKSAEPASCFGCGQRVKHEGYCYKCAA